MKFNAFNGKSMRFNEFNTRNGLFGLGGRLDKRFKRHFKSWKSIVKKLDAKWERGAIRKAHSGE